MLLRFPVAAPWQNILVGSRRLFLTHGHLYTSDNIPLLEKDDFFISGHTHIPVAEKRDERVFFNLGSVSIPKGERDASYGMLEDGMLNVRTLNGDAVIAQGRISP